MRWSSAASRGKVQIYAAAIHDHNERVTPVVTFIAHEILQGGWLVEAEPLAAMSGRMGGEVFCGPLP